jgi:hypothetical protein
MTTFKFRIRKSKYYYRFLEICMPTDCKISATEKAKYTANIMYRDYLKMELINIKSE